MGRKGKVSFEEKTRIVEMYLNGICSQEDCARIAGVTKTSVQQWIRKYETFGIEGLNTKIKHKKYTRDLKESAVRDYMNGLGSLSNISKKYKIHSLKQLHCWVMKYNSHEKLKTSGTGGITSMTKGRKTTYEERIEIIKYCIEHQNNYAETAQKFNVSYQQVYSWTKKYETKGIEALVDKRGKKKPEREMTELEKLKAKNRLLEAEIRNQKIEITFLKKLEEIERGRS